MSQATSTPPWLRDDTELSTSDVQPLNVPIQEPRTYDSAAISKNDRKTTVIYWMLKIITMILCVLMAVTAIIGIGKYDVHCVYFSNMVLNVNYHYYSYYYYRCIFFPSSLQNISTMFNPRRSSSSRHICFSSPLYFSYLNLSKSDP